MIDLVYAGLFGVCVVVVVTLAASLIGDWIKFCVKEEELERRKEMEKIAKKMIQEWKDSQ